MKIKLLGLISACLMLFVFASCERYVQNPQLKGRSLSSTSQTHTNVDTLLSKIGIESSSVNGKWISFTSLFSSIGTYSFRVLENDHVWVKSAASQNYYHFLSNSTGFYYLSGSDSNAVFQGDVTQGINLLKSSNKGVCTVENGDFVNELEYVANLSNIAKSVVKSGSEVNIDPNLNPPVMTPFKYVSVTGMSSGQEALDALLSAIRGNCPGGYNLNSCSIGRGWFSSEYGGGADFDCK
jgi:hypothetical protein